MSFRPYSTAELVLPLPKDTVAPRNTPAVRRRPETEAADSIEPIRIIYRCTYLFNDMMGPVRDSRAFATDAERSEDIRLPKIV